MTKKSRRGQQKVGQHNLQTLRARETFIDQIKVPKPSDNTQQFHILEAKELVRTLRTLAEAGTLKLHLLSDVDLYMRFTDEILPHIHAVSIKAVADDCAQLEDRIAWWKFCKDVKKGAFPLRPDSKEDLASMLIGGVVKRYLDEINPDPADTFCFGSFASTHGHLWKRIVVETRAAGQLPIMLEWLQRIDRNDLQTLMRSQKHKLLLGLLVMAHKDEVQKIFDFLRTKDISVERTMYLDDSGDARSGIRFHPMWEGISLTKFCAFAEFAQIIDVPTVITLRVDRSNESYIEKHISASDFGVAMSWMRERNYLFTAAQIGAVRDNRSRSTHLAVGLLKAGKVEAYFDLPVSHPIDHDVLASQLAELVGKNAVSEHFLSQITPAQWVKISEHRGLGTNTGAQLGYALLPARQRILQAHSRIKGASPV